MITFQRESHILSGPPTSVTWRQVLRKQTRTCTSTALTAKTHWFTQTRPRSLSRYHPRLDNVNCAWSWIRCEINRAIYGVNTVLWWYRRVCMCVCLCVCVCVWCVCVCWSVCVSETHQGPFLPLGPSHVAILMISKLLHPIFQYERRHDGLRSSAFD
jgi:hypothetical protein